VIPPPTQVSGKEYTDYPDKDASGNLDPMQVITWDGVGGVADSFDYTKTIPDISDAEVDALANHGDALFLDVIANRSALLISVQGDPIAPILYEAISGAVGVWATAPQINQHGVKDLDALEVWGPELIDDSDMFSLMYDPLRVAIWAFTPPAGPSVTYVTDAQIANAIGMPGYENKIDLDGLMVYDTTGDDYFDPYFDWIMFSIMPIGMFDGGEIWVWGGGNPAAQFLNHGGHLWDTNFNVTARFGAENVDALEAVSTVPEPGTLILLGTGLAGIAGYVRLRLRRGK